MGLMTRLTTRHVTRFVLGLGAVLLVLVAIDASQLRRVRHWNELIDTQAVPAEGNDLAPELRFARATAHAASGADDSALTEYRALQTPELQADRRIVQAARFNSANLLMRQALKLREGKQPGQALPLIELAKETYREILRIDPAHWDARYNLERAQRLLADPDESEALPAEPPHGAERAATTMRGFSPGLP